MATTAVPESVDRAGIGQDTVLNLTAYGSETRVPDHDICRLSYYLKCCTVGCGIMNHLSNEMIDYMNAHHLPAYLQEAIVHLAFQHFNLLSLIDRAFILDDQHILLPQGTLNTFYEIETASLHFSIDQCAAVTLAGQQIRVHKVMLCTIKWMQDYYLDPFLKLQLGRMRMSPQPPTSSSTGLSQPSSVPGEGSSVQQNINPATTENSSHPPSMVGTGQRNPPGRIFQDGAPRSDGVDGGNDEDDFFDDDDEEDFFDDDDEEDDDDYDLLSYRSIPPVVAILVSPGGESSLSRNAGCLMADPIQHASTRCQHCARLVFRRIDCIGFYRCSRCPEYILCDECFTHTSSLSRDHDSRHAFECMANPEHLRRLRMRQCSAPVPPASGNDNNNGRRNDESNRHQQQRRHRSSRHSHQAIANRSSSRSPQQQQTLEIPIEDHLPPTMTMTTTAGTECVPVAVPIPTEISTDDQEDATIVFAPAVLAS